MTPKLYKAGDVCELLQVQPYVLRSWEKEFPGIGLQGKSPDSPRLYRQSDLEHVQRIKQLVFGEGLRELQSLLSNAPSSNGHRHAAARRVAKRTAVKRSAAPKRGAIRNVKASATRKKKATRKH